MWKSEHERRARISTLKRLHSEPLRIRLTPAQEKELAEKGRLVLR